MACTQANIKTWRTPNGWVFIAVCEVCGAVASSMSDGGAAIMQVSAIHQKRENQDTPAPIVVWRCLKCDWTGNFSESIVHEGCTNHRTIIAKPCRVCNNMVDNHTSVCLSCTTKAMED